jgi:hypothetical protein
MLIDLMNLYLLHKQHGTVLYNTAIAELFMTSTVRPCIYDALRLDAINNFDGGERSLVGENATVGIFVTVPQPYLSIASGFGDQVTNVSHHWRNSVLNSGGLPWWYGGILMKFWGLQYIYSINVHAIHERLKRSKLLNRF